MKLKRRKSDALGPQPSGENLPLGAEAAIWSILETIPDPRNHLALSRDPTAEVTLSPAAINEALALAIPWTEIPSGVDIAGPFGALRQTEATIRMVDPPLDTELTRQAEIKWATAEDTDNTATIDAMHRSTPSGIRWADDAVAVRGVTWPDQSSSQEVSRAESALTEPETAKIQTAEGDQFAKGA